MNEVQVNSQGNVQSVDFTSQEPMQPQRSSQTEMMVTRQAQDYPEHATGFGYISHFATCEAAQMFRKKKKAAAV